MPNDTSIQQLVKATPNFGFLGTDNPKLLRAIVSAECHVFTDPVSALFRIRQFAELLVSEVSAIHGRHINKDHGDTFYTVTRDLYHRNQLPREIYNMLTTIRKDGNDAVHEVEGNQREALSNLSMAHKIATWFNRTHDRYSKLKPHTFRPPPKPKNESARLEKELEELRAQLLAANERNQSLQEEAEGEVELRQRAEREAQEAYAEAEAAMELAEETAEEAEREQAEWQTRLDNLRVLSEQRTVEEAESLRQLSEQVGSFENLNPTEAETRMVIDQQLRDAGWEADTIRLSYQNGVRPTKGRNIAIAEWPTKSGPADYVLFVGLTAVAVVEAKRRDVDVRGALEQSKRYAQDFLTKDACALLDGDWGAYKIPFLFATNGRPYLKQIVEKSGIWFRDARRPNNLSQALPSWYTPTGLLEEFKKDIEKSEYILENETMEYLDLRDYQEEAILSVEKAIFNGQTEVLLAMATGTGKTRTALGLIYRLIKSKRFRRVLFLVDRTSLGEQAQSVFQNVKLEALQSFSDIYDVKGMGDVEVEEYTRLHVTTVQGLVRRILYAPDAASVVPIDQYDCIIVDESHRGYNLDKEMSEGELEFRSQGDYISKYRRVLEHFVAVRIGLTATPALHTKQIFGEPVFEYTYRQAVVDGHLIDHEPPYIIQTELNQGGIHFAVGEEVQEYIASTAEIISYNTPDEVDIEVEGFNTKVRTEKFNKTVCEYLVGEIDPMDLSKTLIFCANNDHADLVVDLLQKAYQELHPDLPEDFVKKLTGATDKHNKAIRVFKNEQNPRIAVTVDLLTTGIDVPEIVNLVFLRRVRSRILYEQMIGRATRLCPELDKEVFRIYDAVGLYEALQDYTQMKPVVRQTRFSFQELVDELTVLDDASFSQEVVEEMVAKFHRIKNRIKGENLERFNLLTDRTPEEFVELLKSADLPAIKSVVVARKQLAPFLDNLKRSKKNMLLSDHADALVGVERGYGKGERPEDYLEGFREFIQNAGNQIPALMVVTQSPKELTRKQLREIKVVLDEKGYTKSKLRTAWQAKSNQDIAASIIGFIRQQALGTPLVSYEERVRKAIAKVKSSHTWNRVQLNWLDKIGKQMLIETIVDQNAMNRGMFKSKGGFKQINKQFGGKLESVLGDLHDAVWDDVG